MKLKYSRTAIMTAYSPVVAECEIKCKPGDDMVALLTEMSHKVNQFLLDEKVRYGEQ